MLTTKRLREKEPFSFLDKEKLRKNRWLNFGLVNIHKAKKKKEMTENDVVIYLHCYSLQPWQTLPFCLNLIVLIFCEVELLFLNSVAVNFAELCVSGIFYLSGSQTVSGLTAAA